MRSFVLALLLASTTALVVSPLAVRRAAAARSPMHIKMGVEDVAANCLEEGCPIDMLEDLIVELKAKKGDKTVRLPELRAPRTAQRHCNCYCRRPSQRRCNGHARAATQRWPSICSSVR